jgi:phage-related protein
MLDYNEELDSSGTYMSCVPYWTDGTAVVIGDRQVGSGSTLTNRGECLPLDVSDKFDSSEGAPTKADVEAMGLSVMNAKNPMIPSQTIHVEFVRLQDMGYEGLENLLECQLCDTVNVVFPYYNTVGKFKIVRTVWDVLADRYESMELGDLSVTLAEALGITSSSGALSGAVTDVRVDGASVVSSGIANIPTLLVDTATASDISVSANSTKAFQVDVTKTGCTPLGVVGYNWSGTGRSHFIIYNMSLSGNTVSMAFGNENGNARSGMGITLYVLYKSN